MPRTVEITLPSGQIDALLGDIREVDGLIGLRLQRGVSLQPPGDVLTVEVTNRGLQPLMQRLSAHTIFRTATTSIVTSEPTSVVSVAYADAITRDSSEATWEEMEAVMGKESNMTVNALLLMALCGVLATVGITTNALHIVIAAMLIAPGFEPITRVVLGVVSRSAAWRRGLADTLKAYAVLALAAAMTTWVLRAWDKQVLGGESSYLPAGVLVGYWTSISPVSLLISLAASIAGALLIATNRSVLTGGVMVALSLVPGATIAAMGIAVGAWSIAGQGLQRLVIEVVLVAGMSLVVFLWKRRSVQRRNMLL